MKFSQLKLSNISTFCLFKTLVRNSWMVVVCAMIFSMSASLYLNWIYQPVYQSSMTYAVTSRQTSLTSSGNLTATQEVSAVLTQMLESNMIYGEIRNFSEELSGFSGTVHSQQVGSSNLIIVTVQADSPKEAFLAICAVQEQFPTIVSYVSSGVVVQIIRNPAVSAYPINAVDAGNTIGAAGLAGAALMCLLLFWFCVSRETIQTRSGARDMLDAPIIGTVDKVFKKLTFRTFFQQLRAPIQVFSPASSFAFTEQINTICAQLEDEAATHGSKLFLITGVSEGEGKSTVSGNVAAALAMRGKKVAVVDCDLRNPTLNRFFDNKYRTSIPLNQLLSSPLTGDKLLECLVRHDQLGLYMLFSTKPDQRCTELLTGTTMEQLLRQLRVFDFVILDTPPMGYFADTEALLDQADASILVVRQDLTPAADINEACDQLRHSKSRFLGIVLNDMTASLTEGRHYGYGYGYGHHYGYGYHHGYGYRPERASDDTHEKGR